MEYHSIGEIHSTKIKVEKIEIKEEKIMHDEAIHDNSLCIESKNAENKHNLSIGIDVGHMNLETVLEGKIKFEEHTGQLIELDQIQCSQRDS